MAVSKSAMKRMKDRYAGPAPLRQKADQTFVKVNNTGPVWNDIPDTTGTTTGNEVIEEEIVEEMVNEPQTAGLSSVPMFIWYIAGAGILFYVAKKQKWIK